MSGDSQRLDLLAVPLVGTQAIEASAGTGKTWTITGLYIRLLLETDLEVSQILVVTYTVAATAELRSRIRERLAEIVGLLRGGEPKDEYSRQLLSRIDDPLRARLRCERALHQLDEAAVLTIHSFCQRALEDGAFESGSAFSTEMLEDQEEQILGCVHDFWRREVQTRDSKFLHYLLVERKYSPARLAAEVSRWIGRPYLRILPPDPAAASDANEAELNALRTALLVNLDVELPRRKAERRELYFDDLLLNLRTALNSDQRRDRLAGQIRQQFGAALIDEFQDTDPVQYEIFSAIYGGKPNPVFFVGDPKQAIYGFRGADIFAYIRARESAHARHSLEENWRSDPHLIDAVNALFARAKLPFVFPEIEFHPAMPAAKDRPEIRLGGLEKAPLRIWFPTRETGEGKALKASAIQERVVGATANEIVRLLELGAAGEAHLGGKPLTGQNIAVLVQSHDQGEAIRRALARRGVASVRRGSESVFASRQAEELERILLAIAEPTQERRIRSALATSFHGLDAAAIYEIAQTERGWDSIQVHFRELRERHFQDGATVMLAHWLDENDVLARLLATPDGERALTNLLHLLELLRAESLRQRQGIERLVAWLADHRRRAQEKGSTHPDAYILRLESDENLVQIVTIHSSKGLQYDVVFCPFTHHVRRSKKKSPVVDFHNPDADWAPTLDFGTADRETHRALLAREELANQLRLFYVALTRAKHACTFTWGPVENGQFSAPGWLLLPRDGAGVASTDALGRPDAAFLAEMEDLRQASGGTVIVEPLEAVDAPVMAASRSKRDGAPLSARRMSRRVRTTRWTTSFSALTAGRGAERKDHDPVVEEVREERGDNRRDIFTFPKGAGPGLCLHRIFEKLDFRNSEETARRDLIVSTLRAFHFDDGWTDVVAGMVADVLATPLDVEGRIRLADVPRSSRLDEIEFHYPASTITRDDLNAILEHHGLPGLARRARDQELPTPLTQGYVKGYIDLVFAADDRFFLVDYKSNWLGSRIQDYASGGLQEVMQEHLYTLQYLTYTVAVHRMLGLRIPDYDYDTHFGGVRYLFLRGMRPSLGLESGVFAHRPPRALVEEFDERLRA